jgi:hypothetical protein
MLQVAGGEVLVFGISDFPKMSEINLGSFFLFGNQYFSKSCTFAKGAAGTPECP